MDLVVAGGGGTQDSSTCAQLCTALPRGLVAPRGAWYLESFLWPTVSNTFTLLVADTMGN